MTNDSYQELGIIPPNKKITFYIFIFVPLGYPILLLFMKYNGIMPQLFMPNDFQAYYYSSQLLFKDIASLYNNPGYIMPYRYFPTSPIFFIFYGWLPYEISYNIGLFLIYYESVIIYLLVLKITKKYFNHNDKEYIWLFYCIGYMILVPYNLILYLQIQTSATVMISILLAYYYFKEDGHRLSNEILGGIFISIAIMLKPTMLIVLPFLIDVKVENKKLLFKKSSFIRILPSFVMLFLNLILFIIYPSLFFGFIQNNFQNIYVFNVLSDSLSTFLSRILNIHPVFLFFLIFSILFSILYYHFLTKKNDLIYYLALSILISLISYIDIWNHSILFLLPLILFIIMRTKSHKDKSKLKIIYYITFAISWINVFNFYFSVAVFNFYYSIFTLYYPILFVIMYFRGHPKLFFTEEFEMHS